MVKQKKKKGVFHPTPYDALFKRIFGQVEKVEAFLSSFLDQAIQETILLDTLHIEDGIYVDDNFSDFRSDLLYTAQLRNKNRKVYFYFLLEHKSDFDHYLPMQLLGYMVRIWEKLGKPKSFPTIYPIVFYHGLKPWPQNYHLEHMMDIVYEWQRKSVPNFYYKIFDLHPYLKNRGIEKFPSQVRPNIVLYLCIVSWN